MTKRKRHSAEFKAKVALEAIREELTTAELAKKYDIHPTMITGWKKTAIEKMTLAFSSKGAAELTIFDQEVEKLHAKIGQLVVERGFFVESLQSHSRRWRQKAVKQDHRDLSVRRQCSLLSLARSGLYCQPRGESAENLKFMEIIDRQFLETPWYGSRQMARHMEREGHRCGRHRVRRLMKLMRLVPIYQEPRTSTKHPAHKIYPYLLRGLAITRPNLVWCTDISYIPMRRGFLYLVAIMDWHSRKVLSWRLSNSMDASFCVEALKEALVKYGPPEICNSDQGSQFTSTDFTGVLLDAKVRISMGGRGRWIDNRMIERLWRSLKYECVYLNAFETGAETRRGIGAWISDYNEKRPHSSHGLLTPAEAYDTAALNLKAAA
ncbi:IS3 family transposase [Paracoccus hibiscisoli]|uniref:IS3 family transposase n=1 Tax=Paracoccus hibiscisoli TaxID=2023261 RepID=A0A4U0QKQ1_9RHOB|nr:IS3 family transposase [Paracoccus hibiscisoli]TJZ76614.1 IS3 family transposase [Paracoccus hibiscisoli]